MNSIVPFQFHSGWPAAPPPESAPEGDKGRECGRERKKNTPDAEYLISRVCTC